MSLVSIVWLVESALALSQPSLQSSPSIELTLQSGPVSVQGLAVLICTVNGVSEVHNFTWYHNGELRLERTGERYINIEHRENVGMLSIHNITIEEAGNYTCIAHTSNTTTPLQESYILRLQVPPLVTAAPRQYVLLGDSATLRCNVTGDPEPVVLWRMNGTVIDLDENARYSKPMLGLLKFTNATTEDAGVYKCIANNAKGGDVTNITLTVLTVPVIRLQPNTATEAGRQTILHCNATGIDTPTVSWRSGGIDVGASNTSRLTSYSNGSLVITNTKVLDTGNYSCIAQNKAGSTNSTTILNVTGRPVLLVSPENTIVKVGSTASLSCSFLANPNDGTIHWQWRDVNLPSTSNKYNIIANGTLIIRETTDDDNGEYQCTVTNSKGNVTAKANLTVISAVTLSLTPSITTPSQPPPDTVRDDDITGPVVGGVVGGIVAAIIIIIIIIILVWYCMKKRDKSRPNNPPVAMRNIPVYDTVQDPAVSDKVKMETNPAYQEIPSDQNRKGPDPVYQELSSHSGRANVSKPAGDVYYEDIINDQNNKMTENPSYAVP